MVIKKSQHIKDGDHPICVAKMTPSLLRDRLTLKMIRIHDLNPSLPASFVGPASISNSHGKSGVFKSQQLSGRSSAFPHESGEVVWWIFVGLLKKDDPMIYQESYLILIKQPNPWCLTYFSGWEKKRNPELQRFDGPPGASFHHTKSRFPFAVWIRGAAEGGFSTWTKSMGWTPVVFARRRVAPCNGCRWGRSWEGQFCLEVFFCTDRAVKKQGFCLGLQRKNCPKITVIENKLVMMIQSVS